MNSHDRIGIITTMLKNNVDVVGIINEKMSQQRLKNPAEEWYP